MGEALSVPFAAAALVLCVAGAAKLRSPGGAKRALRTLGVTASGPLVRAFGGVEVALGLWCVVAPGPVAGTAAACMYVGFAAVARALSERRASCGCFGDGELPASGGQVLLSLALATVCVAAAARTPHGLGWILGRPPGLAGALVVALGGCAYALVLAYTLLPAAWGAWVPDR